MGLTRGNYLEELAASIRALVPRQDLPDEDTHELFRIYAVLALAKGEAVSAADVHNAWVAWMLARNPNHESLVPYSGLPADTADADQPFVDAIRTVSKVD
jgi:hypothetical protein